VALLRNSPFTTLRLAGKKFGHPAGLHKIPNKNEEKFEPKTMEISTENLGIEK